VEKLLINVETISSLERNSLGKKIGRHKLLVEKMVTCCSHAGVVVATEAGGRVDITLHNLDSKVSELKVTRPKAGSKLDSHLIVRKLLEI
jgi:hypothetical protein